MDGRRSLQSTGYSSTCDATTAESLRDTLPLLCNQPTKAPTMTGVTDETTSLKTVILLFLCLFFLVLLLLFLYKKLNKQTDGEYTVSNVVLGEGGLRDRGRELLRDACLTHLGVRLWADQDDDEEDSESGVGREEWGEEGEEGEEQEGDSRGSASDEEDDEEEEEEGGRKGDGEDVPDGRANVPNDKNPACENTQLIVVVEQTRGGWDGKEKEEVVEEVEEKAGSNEEEEQGPGLMINLKQFSGGAMWSEDDKDDGTIIDLTVLQGCQIWNWEIWPNLATLDRPAVPVLDLSVALLINTGGSALMGHT
ncbi:unnamed protein product [Boreogadus saida]